MKKGTAQPRRSITIIVRQDILNRLFSVAAERGKTTDELVEEILAAGVES